MRAERILRIMFLLRTHARVTAGELARRLEVSTRTIQRDLEALSLAGVPVYAERGRGGGWVLAPDYRTRLDGLTPAETMAVFLGTTGHVLADLGLAADADSGFAKLLSTVPAHARGEAERARQRILIDHTGWRGAGAGRRWLEVLQAGLWEERRVRIRYGGGDAERTVDPLGLVAKGNHWYLLAGTEAGIRTYRVSRIGSAVLTGQTFARPAGFDLATYWQQAQDRYFASLRDYPVRLRVRSSVVSRLWLAPNVAVDRVVDGPDGWSQVWATFEKAYETRAFLLGLAGDVVVLAPAALRAAMTEAAQALVKAHLDPQNIATEADHNESTFSAQ